MKSMRVIFCYIFLLSLIIFVNCDNEREKEEAINTVNIFINKYNNKGILKNNEILYFESKSKIVFYIECLYDHCGNIKSFVYESDVIIKRSSLIEEIKFSKDYILAKGVVFIRFDKCEKRFLIELIKYTPVNKSIYKIYDIIEM